MDYQVYATRREADAARAEMRGWYTRAVRLYWPEHPMAARGGYIWVIQCRETRGGPVRFLRKDGYVR